jgi:biotin transporter BioY
MTVRLERTQPSLLHAMTAHADLSGAIRGAAVLFVTVLTIVAAQVSVPLAFTPVPFTLQPRIVLLGGAALGERRFDRKYLTSVVAMGAGLAIVFAFGVAWIAWGAPHAGLSLALSSGLYPFLPADVLKVFVAAAVLPAAWRFLR